jgi:Kef-type K+ transport system membrane component KefB/voltage-gated potassium channel Kch
MSQMATTHLLLPLILLLCTSMEIAGYLKPGLRSASSSLQINAVSPEHMFDFLHNSKLSEWTSHWQSSAYSLSQDTIASSSIIDSSTFFPFDVSSSSTSLMLNDAAVTAADAGKEVDMGMSKTLTELGNDLFIFLCATIGIVPLFKALNASPVIGFLAAGLLMGPAGIGVFQDLQDLESLSEAGVLFLLFEQGLELTVERLTALSKYAFGMGLLQMILTTAAFFVFPFIGGVNFLEVIGGPADLVSITRLDEALVVGAALSLSSSAFVLKIMQEKNELNSKYGSAALGILLFQDIAVVPLLVLLPIIENSDTSLTLGAQAAFLGATFAKALLGLGAIVVVGGAFVRFLFSLVAQTKSSETFVALVLLVALGTGALTDSLGLSSTLGAFAAGTLLAESNYRTQIESDIKPFRGLLLGLFFLTTGASVDPYVIREQWTTVIALLAGLISFKTIITSSLGPLYGLNKIESVKTGLLLSGGGEFAFVVLTLADKLEVIPDKLAKVLVGVVVLSMAITPYLSQLGDAVGAYLQKEDRIATLDSMKDSMKALKQGMTSTSNSKYLLDTTDEERAKKTMEVDEDTIVICGFNKVSETVIRLLAQINTELENDTPYLPRRINYMAFDLDPQKVIRGYRDGLNILYGDGSQVQVLDTAGVTNPRLFILAIADGPQAIKAVERIREVFPLTPVIVRATDTIYYNSLIDVGATRVLPDELEASLRMGFDVVRDLGLQRDVLEKLIITSRKSLELQLKNQYDEHVAVKLGINKVDDRDISPDGFPFPRPRTGFLDDVTSRMSDVTSTLREMSAKRSDMDVNEVIGLETPSTVTDEDELIDGVDICMLPDKKNKGTISSNYNKEEKEDLVDGVDICMLPPKEPKDN